MHDFRRMCFTWLARKVGATKGNVETGTACRTF